MTIDPLAITVSTGLVVLIVLVVLAVFGLLYVFRRGGP